MKNSPKITIAKNAGFCFGVKRAYDLACKNSKKRGNIFILGKLVHNNDVCADLAKKGIREIKSIDDTSRGAVIFTAHGVGPGVYEKASARGLKIIDTTCPKVMKVQRLAKAFAAKKCKVILFGDKQHKEVKSIREWSENKARIIESLDELKKIKLDKNKRHCLLSQTTQNTQEFHKIRNYLAKNLKNFTYFSTICPSTDNRQKEVRLLAKSNDAVIVIGGRDSANSKRLYEIAKKINPKTHFIENEKDLNKSNFKNLKKIAIAAGASTPEWVIKRVVNKIKKIA